MNISPKRPPKEKQKVKIEKQITQIANAKTKNEAMIQKFFEK